MLVFLVYVVTEKASESVDVRLGANHLSRLVRSELYVGSVLEYLLRYLLRLAFLLLIRRLLTKRHAFWQRELHLFEV